MSHSLPVIVGFGGYNAAGRSSSHQAFRRMVFESLPSAEQQETVVGLACLMGLVQKQAQGYTDQDGTVLNVEQVDVNFRAQVLDGTLIRKIGLFDPSAVATALGSNSPILRINVPSSTCALKLTSTCSTFSTVPS